MTEIKDRVKTRRKELGMTQEDLARKLGLKSKSSIAKVEKGTNDISQSKIPAYAKALDVSIEWLLMGDESKGNKKDVTLINHEKLLIDMFESLEEEQRERILKYANMVKEGLL